MPDVPGKINGFTVIAHREVNGALHILGHRRVSGTHEYVVGRDVRPDGKSWGSGYYTFDLTDALDALGEP